MKIATCPNCNIDTAGNHGWNCPFNPNYNGSNTPQYNQPAGSTINFEIKQPIERIGLITYPKEPYAIFELPVRKNKKHYQVWTGKKWYRLDIIKIRENI